MCQNPSGRILKNPAKYGFEIADAISKPIGYETCKGSMFHNPASPDRFLKKPAKYEFLRHPGSIVRVILSIASILCDSVG